MPVDGMTFNGGGADENSLLQDILTIDAKESGNDGTLLEMYRDLIFIGERLRSGIQSAVERDAKIRGEKGEEEDDEDEDDDEEEEDSDKESEDEDDESTKPKVCPISTV